MGNSDVWTCIKIDEKLGTCRTGLFSREDACERESERLCVCETERKSERVREREI